MIRIERIFQILFVDGTPLPCGGKDNMHTITERRKVEEKRKKKKKKKSRGKKKKRKKGTKRTENAFYERSIFLAPQKRHSSGRFPSFFFILQDAGRPPHANSWSSDKGWQGQLQFGLQPLELWPAISRWRRWKECDGTVLTLFPGLSVQHRNNCEYWHCWSVIRLCRQVCTAMVG